MNIEKILEKKDIKELTKAMSHFAKKHDMDNAIRCIEKLAEAGDPSDAFFFLSTLLKSETPAICRRAIAAAVNVRETVRTTRITANMACNALIEAVKREGPLCDDTRKHMTKLGYNDVVDGLIGCLKSERDDILIPAIEALGTMDDPIAISHLEALAAASPGPIAKAAEQAIAKLKS
jgi:hypothetical protein